jgi:hypothetical protein
VTVQKRKVNVLGAFSSLTVYSIYQESPRLAFFFDVLPADTETIRVIDNTMVNGFKAYDETTDSEVDYNIDLRGF